MGTGTGSTGPPIAFDEDDPTNAGALLTAARRASSWGQGDTELTELVSVQSIGQDLNEQEMNVGAGGIAKEGSLVPAVGGMPSVVAASTSASEAVAKAIVNSRRLSMTPVAASGSGSGASAPGGGLDVSLREEDIQRYGPPVFDDTSTIGSVDRDGDDDPEWRRGSELEDDFYDDDDPPDDDDASRNFSDDEEEEEEEAGVTFSPRKHGPTHH
jgi:[calcium/calmodulin-dependent protein kinase] kinase